MLGRHGGLYPNRTNRQRGGPRAYKIPEAEASSYLMDFRTRLLHPECTKLFVFFSLLLGWLLNVGRRRVL